jgi:hypothetical protein
MHATFAKGSAMERQDDEQASDLLVCKGARSPSTFMLPIKPPNNARSTCGFNRCVWLSALVNLYLD